MNQFEEAFKFLADERGRTQIEVGEHLRDAYGWSKTYAYQRLNFLSSMGFIKKNRNGLYILNLKDIKDCISGIKVKLS